eukprot:12644567-Alexandrium_andersonii.AAC.1
MAAGIGRPLDERLPVAVPLFSLDVLSALAPDNEFFAPDGLPSFGGHVGQPSLPAEVARAPCEASHCGSSGAHSDGPCSSGSDATLDADEPPP